MGKGFKVALPGYDATQDTDPNHFALYVDNKVDYVLIKEKVAAKVSVPNGNTTIAHGLGYVPLCFVFAEVTTGVWRKLFSAPIDGIGFYFTVDATSVTLYNSTGSAVNFSYHIFYDNIT